MDLEIAHFHRLRRRVLDRRLEDSVERDYYEKQSQALAMMVTALGVVIAVFFSIGAMIGAAITMYGSIASRQREIGTLRALGFSRGGILLSFLLESLLLSLVGGAVGAAASMAMKFVRFSTINFASFSEVVFTFDPSLGTVIAAVVFAAFMGLLGGLFPEIRAARMSAVQAMRA